MPRHFNHQSLTFLSKIHYHYLPPPSISAAFCHCRVTMAVFSGATTLGSVSFSSHLFDQQSCFLSCPLRLLPSSSSSPSHRSSLLCIVKSLSSSATADTDRNFDQSATSSVLSASNSLLRDTSDDTAAGPSDWKTAKAYCKSGDTFEGEVEGYNGGGLLIRFHSLVGFLPYPQLSPSRSCKGNQNSLFFYNACP